jgi:hypothetical protein
MASLIGIRILCKAGCKVTFDDKKCEVVYKDNIILRGYKDPTTDLWTLPLTPGKIAKTTPVEVLISHNSAHMMLNHHVEHAKVPISHAAVPEQPSPCMMLDGHTIKITPPQPGPCKRHAHYNPVIENASFSYAQTNKTKNVKFAHQSLCNPLIASLIKAINAGFLKGAPQLDAHSVKKYLFASPATSKEHIKQPRKEIQSRCTTKPTAITQMYPLLPRPLGVDGHTMPNLNNPQHNNKVDNCTSSPPPPSHPGIQQLLHCQRILLWRVCGQTLRSRIQ